MAAGFFGGVFFGGGGTSAVWRQKLLESPEVPPRRRPRRHTLLRIGPSTRRICSRMNKHPPQAPGNKGKRDQTQASKSENYYKRTTLLSKRHNGSILTSKGGKYHPRSTRKKKVPVNPQRRNVDFLSLASVYLSARRTLPSPLPPSAVRRASRKLSKPRPFQEAADARTPGLFEGDERANPNPSVTEPVHLPPPATFSIFFLATGSATASSRDAAGERRPITMTTL